MNESVSHMTLAALRATAFIHSQVHNRAYNHTRLSRRRHGPINYFHGTTGCCDYLYEYLLSKTNLKM